MTDWQHWAVALIVLLCLWSIVKSVRREKRNEEKMLRIVGN